MKKASPAPTPAHFTLETLRFLRELARNNDREWFKARLDVYERALKAPMLGLVEGINAAMAGFAPDHVRAPNKTMLRIHRDTRFSSDKRPYKKHVAAWFGRKGAVRTSGAGFYLQISPAEVLLAAGVFMPTPEQLLAIRRRLAEGHQEFRSLLKQVTRERKGELPFAPADAHALARVPKGFAADHPAGELLRARRWGVHLSMPAEMALQPEFCDLVVKHFRKAAPVVRALDAAFGETESEAARKRVRALF